MKKFILNKSTAQAFAGILRKMIAENGSIIFPREGKKHHTSRFGELRKISSIDPMKLTTSKVVVELVEDGIRIFNPLNEDFGYADTKIEFGSIILSHNSFFWKDSFGYWRQMQFSKHPGWALYLTNGRTDIFLPHGAPRVDIRRIQFLTGTGDW